MNSLYTIQPNILISSYIKNCIVLSFDFVNNAFDDNTFYYKNMTH